MPHMEVSGYIMGCQPITSGPIVFKRLAWADVQYPSRIFGGGRSGLGQPSKSIFEPDQKTNVCPAQLRKNNCLCMLEGLLTTSPIVSATSPSRSKFQYICALPISK